MQNRKLLQTVAVLVVFILLVAGATYWLTRPASVDITNVKNVDSSLASSVAYDSTSLLAPSSSDGFVIYNFRTGDVQHIATGVGITSPDSLAVSSDKRYVSFHTNFVQPGTQLATTLQSKQADLGSDYWWVYDTKSNQYWPLPEGAIHVRFYKQSVLALVATPNGERLASFSLQGEAGEEVPVSGISDFFPVSDGYLLQATKGGLFYTQGGVTSKKVAESTAIVGGTDDMVIVTQKDDKGQRIAAIKLANYSVKKIAGNTGGKQAWLNEGILLYGQLHGSVSELHHYDLHTEKDVIWSVKNNGTKYTDLTPVTAYSSSTALVYDSSNNYLVISEHALNAEALETSL